MNSNKIISISLKQDVLDEIEKLEQTGFSGRSDVIRAGVRALSQELQEREKLKGNINAILIMTYAEKYSKDMHDMQHGFGELVRTKLHNHLENHRCMELLVLQGEGKKVRTIADQCQKHKGMEYVKLVVL